MGGECAAAEVGELAGEERGEEAGGVFCEEEGDGSGEGTAGAEGLGALHELGQEAGRDLGEVEELEPREDREDHEDHEEGPCGCAGAVPAADCEEGVAVLLEAHEEDHDGEKAGCEEVEREGAVDEDHEEPPDHQEEPLVEELACEGRFCMDCCEFELVVVAPVANGGVDAEFDVDAERGGN